MPLLQALIKRCFPTFFSKDKIPKQDLYACSGWFLLSIIFKINSPTLGSIPLAQSKKREALQSATN